MRRERITFCSVIMAVGALVFAPHNVAAQDGYTKDYDAAFARLSAPPVEEKDDKISVKFSLKGKKIPSYLRINAKRIQEVAHEKLTVFKDNFLSEDMARRTKVMIDEESFLSSGLNQGMDVDTAKMAGFVMSKDTAQSGTMQIGGGYMWGEENPIFAHNNLDEGFMVGGQYKKGKWNLQLSLISKGHDFGGVNLGGRTEHNALIGANYQMNNKVGFSAGLRFQNKDRTNLSDNAMIMMVGTRIEF